mmetsp:Transcript_11522/g.28010  ORF Transcript_11522/g.28010 Transcript_11522/m.28010 type:complete len:260 (+) Transcript_11522:590-1369(+)
MEHCTGDVAVRRIGLLHIVVHVAHLVEVSLNLHVLLVVPAQLAQHEPRLEHLVQQRLLHVGDLVIALHPHPQVLRLELPELDQHGHRAALALLVHRLLAFLESLADALLHLVGVSVHSIQQRLDLRVILRALLQDLHPLQLGAVGVVPCLGGPRRRPLPRVAAASLRRGPGDAVVFLLARNPLVFIVAAAAARLWTWGTHRSRRRRRRQARTASAETCHSRQRAFLVVTRAAATVAANAAGGGNRGTCGLLPRKHPGAA